MNRFVHMRRHSLADRLLSTYLRQPYAFFLGRNTADLAKAILSEVDLVIGNVFLPLFHLVAYSVVVLALALLVVFVDPWVALGAAVVVAGLYVSVFALVRGRLEVMGRERVSANRERYVAATEALNGIKDIKILGREDAYLRRFAEPSSRFARHMAMASTLSEVPKYLVEAVGVGGILVVALVLVATRSGATVFPILGLYAFAGYKLIPAAQRIYEGVAKLRFGAGSIESLHEDMVQLARTAALLVPHGERISPSSSVELAGVSFRYDGAANNALNGIRIRIEAGTGIGLVGKTGAGKTTLVDIVLGLLTPTEGAFLVDGQTITDSNRRMWQSGVGYVPQSILLADLSIAENIALGVPMSEIDLGKVEACAKLANLQEFIEEQLPKKYSTRVGDRGVRLSGGQRQRIGIARALYHDPDVIVFDEATSALDTLTEDSVMSALHALAGKKTIIIIAHRLSTVRHCHQIFMLEHGQVVANGRYEDLVEENAQFRQMTGTHA